MKILLLGANGFIGSNLSAYALAHRDWEFFAMDLHSDRLAPMLGNPRFHFTQGDITAKRDWIEAQIEKCDVILPLVAIANPAIYVKNPLAVFELDFVANLEIVRLCVKHKKRIIFPSTSEVYGMSPDTPYNEETSNLVTGPIKKERWIYSSSKQLMDRVIYAYGQHQGLPFTLFRPFNWFGPGLDDVWDNKKPSRVVSQFLSNIFHKRDIVLIGGGGQKRCFLYIDDAIDALVRIIDNKNGAADGQIFNIGHPGNEASIAELAEMMLDVMGELKGFEKIRSEVKLVQAKGEEHFGAGFQDIDHRVPDVSHARRALGWQPKTTLKDAIRHTITHYYTDVPKKLARA